MGAVFVAFEACVVAEETFVAAVEADAAAVEGELRRKVYTALLRV